MASVHKTNRSKFWMGAFRLNGQLISRSTKCTKRADALRVALQWEEAAKAGITEQQIRKVFEDLHEKIHGSRMRSDSPRQFFARWIGRREQEIAAATARAYRDSAERFFKFLGERSERPIAELQVSDLTAFRDELSKRTSAANGTNHLKKLKPWVIDAWREGQLPDNVAGKLPRTKREKGIKRRPFTREEIRRILNAASPEWQGMILAGAYTGQRLGDIANLRWAHVDLATGTISFQTAKTGRQQIIPTTGQWRDWLLENAGDDAEGYLFPQAAEAFRRAGGKVGTLSNQFHAVLVSAGLAEPRSHQKKENGKGRDSARNTGGLSFHCLRYSATSLLKAAGVAEAIVRDIVGHDSAAVSMSYTQLDEATKAAALENLPQKI